MNAVRYSITQLRLLLAERMIGWAMQIAPPDHPDSVVFAQAALLVASREPANTRPA